MQALLLALLAQYLYVHTVGGLSGGRQEYCDIDTFNVTCPDGHVIIMDEAWYGRMRLGKCVRKNLGYLGCSTDAMLIMDARCSGRRRCQVPVVELAKQHRHHPNACTTEVSSYLEASYHCRRVHTGRSQMCPSRSYVKVPPEGGLLASGMATQRGYGSISCPWVIQAHPGQLINITLHNFARMSIQTTGTGGKGETPDACYEFAVIKDGTSRKNVIACTSDPKIRQYYLSNTNTLEIYVLDRVLASQSVHFLLEYNIAGCPELKIPVGAHLEQLGNKATVSCVNTQDTWTLICQDNMWTGFMGNCSHAASWGIGEMFANEDSFPYGILIVVAIGVALGVFFGGLLLFAISMYMKRRQPRSSHSDHVVEVHAVDEKYMTAESDYSSDLLSKGRSEDSRSPMPLPSMDTVSTDTMSMGVKECRRPEQGQYNVSRGSLPPPPYLQPRPGSAHVYESPQFS